MQNNKLKYANCDIVFQEVPDEITLAINITGCPHKCEGCHSDYLWDYSGNYVDDDIDSLLDKYKNMITCVCFMGGDQNMENLKSLLIKVKKEYGLKTCVYSGVNDIEVFNDILEDLDYLKIGSFNKELGGINKKTTNQKFYKIHNKNIIDITYKFIK